MRTTKEGRALLAAPFQDYLSSGVVVVVGGDVVDRASQTQPGRLRLAVLRQLLETDLAHFGRGLVLPHDLHVLVVRLAVLAHLLQSLQLLHLEGGTHPAVLGR